jgi:hypothetical protein
MVIVASHSPILIGDAAGVGEDPLPLWVCFTLAVNKKSEAERRSFKNMGTTPSKLVT